MTDADEPDDAGAAGDRSGRTATVLKLAALGLVVVGVVVAGATGVLPDVDAVQREVRSYGAWGPLVYVVAYAVLVMFPTPASVLTIAGGTLFGLVEGTALALVGASLGATAAFEVGRLLGRDAVRRLARGRLDAAERVLDEHGLVAVLAIRLTPIFPFLVVNYGAGLSSLRRRDYLVGTVVGIVPGAIAYASVGAYGTDPWRLFVAVAALVVLTLGGAAVGRRILHRRGVDVDAAEDPEAAEPAAARGPDAGGRE